MHHRLAIRYAVEGDLRFISHQDTLRLFERALARAELPVRFSQGFNPRPRMRIALPRPVGVASGDELLLLEMNEQPPADAACARLAAEMPAQLTLLGAEWLEPDDRKLPSVATYSISVASYPVIELADRVAGWLASERMAVERVTPGRPPRRIDLRPFVLDMTVREDRLSWRQTLDAGGTARVGEVLESLGLAATEHLHRVRRDSVLYQR